jgi:hypothetical protein
MWSLVERLTLRELLVEQVPAMGGAWILAELFYKFHSFTLECAAFLATWAVLDRAIRLVTHPRSVGE